MYKNIRTLAATFSFILGLLSLGSYADEVTITTYYPSPYGTYNQLTTYSNTYLAASGGNVGIGTTGPRAKLDIQSGGYSPAGIPTLSMGADFFAPTRTNNTAKHASIGTVHYANSEEPIATIAAASDSANSVVYIGGGIASLNAATDILFFTANNTTTINGSPKMIIDRSGNVGIGIASPEAKLHINGNIKASLNSISGGQSMEYQPSTNEIGVDVAELFEANEEVEPADVLSIDENGKLKKSSRAYDTKVAGIVSDAPAILFEGSTLQVAPQPFEFKKGKKPPLALAGRVKCKVTTYEGGSIKTGDLLVTSSNPGRAMKAKAENIRFGTVIGKALESLNEGEGKITVLVTLQ